MELEKEIREASIILRANNISDETIDFMVNTSLNKLKTFDNDNTLLSTLIAVIEQFKKIDPLYSKDREVINLAEKVIFDNQ